MAPNLRQLSLLSEDSLADVSALVRAKVVVPSLPATTATATASPDASYWDWPANVPADLFSVQHLEENLIRDARASLGSSSSLVAEHDDYWNESLSSSSAASAQPVTKALHTQVDVEDADAYWAEPSHTSTVSDAYWTLSSSSSSSSTATATSSGGHRNDYVATEYWDERNYGTPTVSENYWYGNGNPSNEASYWEERSSAVSASDRYWAMAVL